MSKVKIYIVYYWKRRRGSRRNDKTEHRNFQNYGNKKKGKAFRKTHKGYWTIWSGLTKKERAKDEDVLIIASSILNNIIQKEFKSER